MDWSSVGFDWNRMRAFLATAEEGSLSAAARALGTSQPTLGRQIRALEAELGISLFERISGRLSLTPGGTELIEPARAMCDAAAQASLSAAGRSQTLEGTVTVSVGELFAAHLMPQIVAKLRSVEPGIQINIVASNRSSDLRRREADIAFRALRPKQPDLYARKIGELASRFYASPSYLERAGPFQTLADLSRGDFIDFDDDGEYCDYLSSQEIELSEARFTARAGSHLIHWEMAKQGLGIVVALEVIGDAEPALARVMSGPPLTFQPMWLVTHRDVKTSLRIRRVFDFLGAELASLVTK